MKATTPDSLIQELPHTIRALMEEWHLPGLAISVVHEGNTIFCEGFGQRDAEGSLPVTPDTLFAIGSTTKAFTTFALAILVDEGVLEWDTPVRRYLPSFSLHDVVAAERATVRDIVTGRTGLPRHDLAWYGSSAGRRELFDRLRYLEPNADFRNLWQYQNLMYMAAGVLIEEVTGESWEAFVRRRIFEPLGIEDAVFSVREAQQRTNIALPYEERAGEVRRVPFREIAAIGPAGSIQASAAHMARWMRVQLEGGKVGDTQLVSASNLLEMHSPQMVIPPMRRYPEVLHNSYGMGWVVSPYRGHDMVWHNGGIDGFYAYIGLLRDHRLGITVLTNLPGQPIPEVLAYGLFDRALGLEPVPWAERMRKDIGEMKAAAEAAKVEGVPGRVEGTHPSHPLAAYAGKFGHPGYGAIHIELNGDALTGTYNSITFALEHVHYDVFTMRSEERDTSLQAAFSMNAKGDIARLAVPFEPSVPDIVFERVPDAGLRNRTFLERFAGEYEVMGQEVSVRLKGEEALLLAISGQPEYVLEPYRDTEFTVSGHAGFSVTFTVNASGAVTGATITQPGGVFQAQRREE